MAERTQTCPHCGDVFVTAHSHQRFCSRRCNKRFSHLRDYRPRGWHTRKCRWCGREFTSRTRVQTACSFACNQQAYARNNREKIVSRVRAWQEANPERFSRRMSDARSRRRFRLANAPTKDITDRCLRRLMHRQRAACAYCGAQTPLTLDHVIPLARGGSHSIGNVVWACKPCNCSKGQKLLIEWTAWKKGQAWQHQLMA